MTFPFSTPSVGLFFTGVAALVLSIPAPAQAQLFENLKRFSSRVAVGDPAVISETREGPKGVCLKDLDGDGHPDIVTANLDGTLSVARGRGGLEFDKAYHLQTGFSTLREVICEDFNEDGLIDLASAAPSEGQVALFFNEGEGQFGQMTALETWPTARNLVAGDFDGDGHRDLAVAGRARGIVLYRGDGTGTLTEWTGAEELASWDSLGWRPVYSLKTLTRPSPTTVTGSQDWLLAAHAHSPDLWILRTNLFKSLSGTNFPLAHVPHSIAVGVVSEAGNEGAPSLVTADKRDGSVRIFSPDKEAWEAGTVGFLEVSQELRIPGAPRDLKLSDLNGDGWNDLIVVLRNFNRLIIYHNHNGVMEPVTETPVGNSPRELAAGHLNDDGLEDFVVINRESADVSVLLASNEETGFEALDQVYPVSGEVAALEVEDLNGDRRADVIQLHRSSGDVSVRLAGPGGQLRKADYYYMGVLPSGLELRDVNADGQPDLLSANLGRSGFRNGEVALRLGRPDGSFGDRLQVPTADGARIFAIEAADFDGDEITDFAVGYFDCRISFFKGSRDNTYKLTRTDRFTYESRVMVTGDFDRDGDIDIAGAGYAGDVVVFVNEGDLLTTEKQKRYDYPPPGTSKFGTREITAIDLNRDGDLDLVVGSGKGAMVLLGGPNASFIPLPTPLPGTEFPASSMAEGDMDGDGYLDLAVSCRILACVTILKGGADGQFLPAVTVDVPAGDFVRAGDVDGDGLTDLVGSGDALWIALSSRGPEAGPPTTWDPRRPPLPQVVINEILPSNSRYRFGPAGSETADAIELYNGASHPIGLEGWILERIHVLEDGEIESREYTFPALSLAADERMVLFASRSQQSLFHTGFKLPASGATLILRDAEKRVVDEVTYPAMEPNISFARYQDGVQAFRHNAFPDLGSRNVDNGELEPTLWFDGFDFENLAPGRPLKVTARANDDVGVISLNLAYRHIGRPELAPSHVVLYDDGEHGDGGLLDGTFAGQLPAFPEGTELQFYVEATDLNNRTTYLPSDPIFATTREQLRNVYTLGLTAGIPGLEISEVVTDNETLLVRDDTLENQWVRGEDYVEIRNTSQEPIDLGGLMLARSFGAQEGSLYTFPEIAPGGGRVLLLPGETRVVHFSDRPLGLYGVPLTLRKNGETVFLMGESPQGARTLLDFVSTPVMGENEAYFRLQPNGEWIRGWATPGIPNYLLEHPELRVPFEPGAAVVLGFPTRVGLEYRLESSDTLEPESWRTVEILGGDGTSHAVEVERQERAFYRLRVQPE